MRTFVFNDGKSNKFWNITLEGVSFTVNFGRAGTSGQTQTKEFPDEAAARKAHDKLVAEKLKKGYVETTSAAGSPAPAPAAAPVLSADQVALERALAEHPDEVAAHSAYADYLMEQGDPRGEFIQTQLALEDPSRPKAERESLKKREAALLKKHAAEWLGEAGPALAGRTDPDEPFYYHFARGWLDFVRVLPRPDTLIAMIARSPESRLLRRLEVVYDMRHHPFDFDQFIEKVNEALPEEEQLDTDEFYMSDPSTILPHLIQSPYLTNLRAFKYGFSDDHPRGPSHSTMVQPFHSNGAEILELLKHCPRLEELYLNAETRRIDDIFSSPLLGKLRVFQYYYGTNYSDYRSQVDPYPLSALAENESLANLTTLRLHAGRDTTIAGGEFEALVRSKHLPALKHLLVQRSELGDAGAEQVVRSGILKRLKTLDLAYGSMTDDGARTLAACPDLKNLELLNLTENYLTPAGIRALQATGVRLIADEQHDPAGDDYHLTGSDWE